MFSLRQLLPQSRIGRVLLPVTAGAIVSVAGAGVGWAVVGNGAADRGGFVVTDFPVPAVAVGSTLTQPLYGLWFDSTPTGFTKVSGSSWLTVSADGTVSGTVPAAAASQPGTITVAGTDGSVTHDLTLEVTGVKTGATGHLEVAAWNLDDALLNATGGAAEGMKQAVTQIIGNGIDVLGLQGTDGTAAAELAGDLGWYDYQVPAGTDAGDLGIVSAYPILAGSQVAPASADGAAGVRVAVGALTVPVWTADADGTDAGFQSAAGCGGASATQVLLGGTADATCGPATTAWTALASESLHAGWGNDTDGLLTPTWPSAHAAAVTVYSLPAAAAEKQSGTLRLVSRQGLDRVSEGGAPSPTTSPSAPVSKRLTPARGVRMTGSFRVGGVLHANAGSITPAPGTISYAWLRNGRSIPHATTASYHPTAADRGKRLVVRVTATKAGYTALVRTSAAHRVAAGTLTRGTPRITGLVRGAPRVGHLLRLRVGAWTAGARLTYRWLRNGTPIAGATRARYRPTRADLGRRLGVRITGAKAGYRTARTTAVAGKVTT